MSKLVKAFLLLLVVYSSSFAQEKTIYLEEVERLFYPELAKKGALEIDHILTFDVVNLKPQNIRLTPLKKGALPTAFKDSLFFQNLDSLIFVNDTTNYSILFDFEYSHRISTNYIEYVKPGHLRIMIQWYVEPFKGCELLAWLSTWNPVDASITIYGTVLTRKNVHWPSDILVECFFSDSTTKAVIVRNNMPVLEKEILENARSRDKRGFLRQNVSKEDSVKHYYIEYNVFRRFGERGFSKVY